MQRLPILVALMVCVPGVVLEAAVVEIYNFTGLNRSVPDGPSYGVANVQSISGSGIADIDSIRVTLNVSSEFNGDLYVTLQHGSGFSVLLNRVGRSLGNPYGYADSGFNITFSDTAGNGDVHNYQSVTTPATGSPLTGEWRPDARHVDPAGVLDTSVRSAFLNQFEGLSANGDWTLFLSDTEFGGQSVLNSWSLELTAVPEPVNTALSIFACGVAGPWVWRSRWFWISMLRGNSRSRR